MLQGIEDGRFHWPQQLATGKSVALGKEEGHQVDPMKHRALLSLPTVYRTWAKRNTDFGA
eukprot:15461146-Alexandrium_andersonii.AAC.1